MKIYKEVDFSIYNKEPIALVIENSDIFYPILSITKDYC